MSRPAHDTMVAELPSKAFTKLTTEPTTHVGQAIIPLHPDAYPCPFCSEHFPEKQEQVAHLLMSHPEVESTPWLCESCPTGYASKEILFKHVRQAHADYGAMRYTCTVKDCQAKLPSEELWVRHMKHDHADFTVDDELWIRHNKKGDVKAREARCCARPVTNADADAGDEKVACLHQNLSFLGMSLHVMHCHLPTCPDCKSSFLSNEALRSHRNENPHGAKNVCPVQIAKVMNERAEEKKRKQEELLAIIEIRSRDRPKSVFEQMPMPIPPSALMVGTVPLGRVRFDAEGRVVLPGSYGGGLPALPEKPAASASTGSVGLGGGVGLALPGKGGTPAFVLTKKAVGFEVVEEVEDGPVVAEGKKGVFLRLNTARPAPPPSSAGSKRGAPSEEPDTPESSSDEFDAKRAALQPQAGKKRAVTLEDYGASKRAKTAAGYDEDHSVEASVLPVDDGEYRPVSPTLPLSVAPTAGNPRPDNTPQDDRFPKIALDELLGSQSTQPQAGGAAPSMADAHSASVMTPAPTPIPTNGDYTKNHQSQIFPQIDDDEIFGLLGAAATPAATTSTTIEEYRPPAVSNGHQLQNGQPSMPFGGTAVPADAYYGAMTPYTLATPSQISSFDTYTPQAFQGSAYGTPTSTATSTPASSLTNGQPPPLPQSIYAAGFTADEFDPRTIYTSFKATRDRFRTFPSDLPDYYIFKASPAYLSYGNILLLATRHTPAEIAVKANEGRPETIFKSTQAVDQRIKTALGWAVEFWPGFEAGKEVVEAWLEQQRKKNKVHIRGGGKQSTKRKFSDQMQAATASMPQDKRFKGVYGTSSGMYQQPASPQSMAPPGIPQQSMINQPTYQHPDESHKRKRQDDVTSGMLPVHGQGERVLATPQKRQKMTNGSPPNAPERHDPHGLLGGFYQQRVRENNVNPYQKQSAGHSSANGDEYAGARLDQAPVSTTSHDTYGDGYHGAHQPASAGAFDHTQAAGLVMSSYSNPMAPPMSANGSGLLNANGMALNGPTNGYLSGLENGTIDPQLLASDAESFDIRFEEHVREDEDAEDLAEIRQFNNLN